MISREKTLNHAAQVRRCHRFGAEFLGVESLDKYPQYFIKHGSDDPNPRWSKYKRYWIMSEHQMVALIDEPVSKVFSNKYNVHHRNGIKCDNRPENLEVLSASDHGRWHALHGKYSRSDHPEMIELETEWREDREKSD